MTSEDDVILQFRIWEQGRVDMEDLIETLQLMAQVRILFLKFTLNPLKFFSHERNWLKKDDKSKNLSNCK